MGWNEFSIAYSIFTTLLLIRNRRLFRGKWKELAQLVAFTITVSSPLDYIAEARGFWTFPQTSGLHILGVVPVDNMSFTAFSSINILIIYLSICEFSQPANKYQPDQSHDKI